MTDDLARRAVLLAGLDLDCDVGLEFGALDRPLVPPTARVRYVDHLDTEGLRQKYAGHSHVDSDGLVRVDVVLDGRPLVESIGPCQVDYVVAAHVAEHVPDLIGWLADLRALLTPGGSIRLALPDLRFTFDRGRRPSGLAEVVAASVSRVDRPPPHHVVEAELLLQPVDAGEVWKRPIAQAAPDRAALQRATELAHAVAEHGLYHDVHCWTFTPRSFGELMQQLVALELSDLGCDVLEHTRPGQLEFFTVLRPMAADAARASWAVAVDGVLALEASVPPHLRDPALLAAGYAAELSALRAQVADLQVRLAAVHASRAWRVFEPYRRVRRAAQGVASRGSRVSP